MANSYVKGLTVETAMAADDAFFMDDGTNDRQVPFSLLGGLEIDTTYNTAADHSNISASAGTLYPINLSSVTTDNLTITLPGTAKLGEKVLICITATNATYELDILTDATGSLLNGTDTSGGTNLYRIWQVGEWLEVTCINAGGSGDTDWQITGDGRIPCLARLEPTANSTTNNAGEVKLVTMGTAIIDRGGCADVANDRITARRDGYWNAYGQVHCNTGINDTKYYIVWVYRSGSNIEFGRGGQVVSPVSSTNYMAPHATGIVSMNSGQYLSLYFQSQDASKGYSAGETALNIEEIFE